MTAKMKLTQNEIYFRRKRFSVYITFHCGRHQMTSLI